MLSPAVLTMGGEGRTFCTEDVIPCPIKSSIPLVAKVRRSAGNRLQGLDKGRRIGLICSPVHFLSPVMAYWRQQRSTGPWLEVVPTSGTLPTSAVRIDRVASQSAITGGLGSGAMLFDPTIRCCEGWRITPLQGTVTPKTEVVTGWSL